MIVQVIYIYYKKTCVDVNKNSLKDKINTSMN